MRVSAMRFLRLGIFYFAQGLPFGLQVMALPVAYNMLRSDGAAIPAGIALAVVSVTALFLLLNPETTRALGIRGPGSTNT